MAHEESFYRTYQVLNVEYKKMKENPRKCYSSDMIEMRVLRSEVMRSDPLQYEKVYVQSHYIVGGIRASNSSLNSFSLEKSTTTELAPWVKAKFRSRAVALMALFFSLTTPIGIAIEIGIANDYHENDQNSLIVEGIFNSASTGILIYMAIVDLLAADFMHPRMQGNGKLQLGANISLFLGAGLMSVLAIWA
ncbi:Zinc transporter 3 [Capsicum annuum]|uniref:Zinc transporter 3 n=1 Tax=Capsicum annuum TaxID=4072 RepID=A0A2G2Z195_CAPAN|nr:Zinc transporter 3 [Capsicum annuum]